MVELNMEKVELGSRIAGETAASLAGIVSGINESTALINEIAESLKSEPSAVAQINVGIDQVANVVQQNSATAEESSAASGEMSSQSAILQKLVSQFKLRSGGRKGASRAGLRW